MKIIFLHLSDMHFTNRKSLSLFNQTKIVEALNVLMPFDKAALIISGDLSQSGIYAEFSVFRHFMGHLIDDLNTTYPQIQPMPIWIAPGNHDVDKSIHNYTHSDLVMFNKNNSYEQKVSEGLDCQANFFRVVAQNSNFLDNKFVSKRTFKFGKFKIEANLINTATFSSLEEDKGLLYIPNQYIDSIYEPTESDFVISIMHHAPEWLNESQKKRLEDALICKSSLIFIGHEHITKEQMISTDDTAAKFMVGGALANKGDWSESEFFATILDTETFQIQTCRFKWSISQQLYVHKKGKRTNISQKPSKDKTLIPLEEFSQKMRQDTKRMNYRGLDEFFVFPDIEKETSQKGEINTIFPSIEKFLQEIITYKKVYIVGAYNSGKTTIVKQLFFELINSKVVLFLDADSVHGKSQSKIIKSAFEDIYGNNPIDFIRFEQLPKEKKVLIIDDADKIDSNSLNHFLDGVEDVFEVLIFSTNRILELDIMQRIKSTVDESNSFTRFKLRPFYTAKRNELINKIVRTQIVDKGEQVRVSNLLSASIKSQRRFFNYDPDFIHQFVLYYCKNIGDIQHNDGNIFSKVFEANITNSLNRYTSKVLTVDKVFLLLSKIAYAVHFNKCYPISEKQIFDIIAVYNENYDSDVSTIELIKMLTQSKIMYACDVNQNFKFINKNYLAFFVARELNRKYNDDHNEQDLKQILHFSCYGINSDILLFVIYITDNPRLLRFVLDSIYNATQDWNEYDANVFNPSFLKWISLKTETAPTAAEVKAEKEEVVKNEEIKEEAEFLQTTDLYDYDETKADDFINQLLRTISLSVVAAKCLPSFEHMMPRDEKQELVKQIYSLPNKIFYRWANEIDETKEELLAYIEEHLEVPYRKTKKSKIYEPMAILQNSAMGLLLDLYNTIFSNCAKDNTERYLLDFDCSTNYTYAVQHILLCEKRSLSKQLIQETEKLYSKDTGPVIKHLILNIVRHTLVFMPSLDFKDREKLQTKFFMTENRSQNILRRSTRIDKE